MKLVLATPLYPPEIGGPATYARELHEGLPTHGIEVELVKFRDVRHLPKFVRHYTYYKRVLYAAKSADVVLALDPVSTGLPAMRAAKKAHKPFVVKVVGDYAWEQGQQRFGVRQTLDEFVHNTSVPPAVKMLRRIQTRVASAATHVIVPSEYLKKIVMAWGISPEKISVIYNAVSLEEIGTAPPALEHLPRPFVVTAGRLVPWKGIVGVIDAIAKLRKNGITASLAVIGEGPERSRLEQHAREVLANDFIFTGQLAHKDALAAMKRASIFVLNSTYEGLSHFLIEAQKLGLPIVASDVGGNPEALGRGGALVASGDVNALAQKMEKITRDPEYAQLLTRGAVESAKRFATATMLAATEKLLRSL